MIEKFELSLRRDESIMRFLTIRVDKYAKKYNDDKRAGLVGRNKKKQEPKKVEEA
jgi:small subunit ribosomal protein S6